MSINTQAGSKGNDAVSMVANQLNIDLSATIKPQETIRPDQPLPDINKNIGAAGAALQETIQKSTNMNQVERALQQQLQQETSPSSSSLGGASKGGLSSTVAKGLLAGIGIMIPSAGVAAAPAPAVVSSANIHAAEAPLGTTSQFTDPVKRSAGKAADEPSVYGDALGGQWDYKTGMPAALVAAAPPKHGPQIDQRELQTASKNAIGVLGVEAVREDLGQVQQAKQRLNQQGQEALDTSSRLGVTPEQSYKVAAPLAAAPAPGGFFR